MYQTYVRVEDESADANSEMSRLLISGGGM